MIAVTVSEAQIRLPELLDAAASGEAVEIERPDGRMFTVSPVRAKPAPTGVPKAGRLKGLLSVPDDFDAPLEELREYMETAAAAPPNPDANRGKSR